MSLFSSLERQANAQTIIKAGHTYLRSSVTYPSKGTRANSSYRTTWKSVSPRISQPGTCVITDTFINCLVMAGFCNEHSPFSSVKAPRTRRSYFSSKTLQNSQVAARLDSSHTIEPENTSETKGDIIPSKAKLAVNRSENPVGAGASLVGSPGPGTTGKKQPSRDSPSKNFKVDHYAYKRARDSGNDDSKALFSFYTGVLGRKAGKWSLRVLLSNPAREMCPPPKKVDKHVTDNTDINGVSRLISLLEDETSSNNDLFRAYKKLPSPGVSHLSHKTRGMLLRRLSKPQRRGRIPVFHFLYLLDDMCAASLYISPAIWTTAIHLVGHSARKVKPINFNSAVGLWRQMENEGNVPGSSITFNVLFNLAVKSGQFKVADRLIEEMKRRGIDFSRFGRVAQIFLHGLKRDAEGVRRAYSEFVTAGEIVDTVVLNCVIASLIRADECNLALMIYERMKVGYLNLAKKKGSSEFTTYPQPSENYTAYRKASMKLGRVLGMGAYLHDKLPHHHRAIQAAVPLAPDSKTFHILLSYHASVTGDWTAFKALLRDMHDVLLIPPQGMVFVIMFQGFALHGGQRDTQWTYESLQRVWVSFLRAMRNSKAEIYEKTRTQKRIAKFRWDSSSASEEPAASADADCYEDEDEDKDDEDLDEDWQYENSVYLGRSLIISCLRAYSACGGPKAVIHIWDQIEGLWRVESQKQRDIIAVKKVLYELIPRSRSRFT
ncbi:hypothetical protein FQN57_005824 [Myotisia sp. PD_48]|nr:hypothetical protein FQN57_005824 [Myotisia sp. PD_48]